jgi:hypothetical protein
VRREQPNACAISRRLRPSLNRRQISSYRRTVMLRLPIARAPSCGTTKVADGARRLWPPPDRRNQCLETASTKNRPPIKPVGRRSVTTLGLGYPREFGICTRTSASVDHSGERFGRVKMRPAGGTEPPKSGGTELTKSGGPQLTKSAGSEPRKFCTLPLKETTRPVAARLTLGAAHQ